MKFFLDSVGCRLNQAEIEGYARQLRNAGHAIVENLQAADAAILNTCAVTGQAVSDSRQKARRMGKTGTRRVFLTGCWSSLATQEAGALPGVTCIVPNTAKDGLVSQILQDYPGDPSSTDESHPASSLPDIWTVAGCSQRTRARTRAFIKVQEGCDNRCTFCITALARGPARSRPLVDVIEDVNDAFQNGAQEIVLSGVHLGCWGADFNHGSRPQRLPHLIQAILAESDVARLRLSSIEPWHLDDEFFDLWRNERLCRHLHIPLQSGCAQTLQRMARHTTPPSFTGLLETIRKTSPDMAVTTDVMVGFPGETEEEFRTSLDFVRSMNFGGGHVFTYSERPGTAAAQMPGAVPHAIRKQRNHLMHAVLDNSARVYRSRFLGSTQKVLWETVTNAGVPDDSGSLPAWIMEGLTDNYLRVRACSPRPLWNCISEVRPMSLDEDVIWGEIISS